MATPADSTQNLSPRAPRSSLILGSILAIWAVTLVAGQIVRLPLFGQSGGILPSDVANVLVILYAMWLSFPRRRESTPSGPPIRSGMTKLSLCAIVPFLLWSLFVLFLHISELPVSALLISLSYWIRLAVTLALLPSFFGIFQYKNNKNLFRPLILFLGTSLVIIGFLQLIVYPSLQGVAGGWDPHSFRMVATWLDPNFFGAFLAILLPYAICVSSNIVLPMLIAIAILLTQSRSTFISIFVAVMLCGVLYLLHVQIAPAVKRLLPLGIGITVVCIALAMTLLGDRAANFFIDDPTVSMRIDAYKQVWRKLVEPNIFLGVGYNAYQFAAKDAGLISGFAIHSRAGSDSSILTLLVTTGIVGTALFLFPIFIAAAFHLRRFYQTQNKYSLCFLIATIVLLMQSQFTNSLLYPHILMTYMLVAAISFVYD